MFVKPKPEFVNQKNMFLLILGLFVLSVTKSLAQSRDSIYYFVPAFVKIKITEYIKTRGSDYPFCAILSYQNDTTGILISRYVDSAQDFVYLIKNSNRYIKLDSTRTIPILLREDFLFSNLLHSVKKEGDPYAVYRHNNIGVSGY